MLEGTQERQKNYKPEGTGGQKDRGTCTIYVNTIYVMLYNTKGEVIVQYMKWRLQW